MIQWFNQNPPIVIQWFNQTFASHLKAHQTLLTVTRQHWLSLTNSESEANSNNNIWWDEQACLTILLIQQPRRILLKRHLSQQASFHAAMYHSWCTPNAKTYLMSWYIFYSYSPQQRLQMYKKTLLLFLSLHSFSAHLKWQDSPTYHIFSMTCLMVIHLRDTLAQYRSQTILRYISFLRGGFNNPRHGNCSLEGSPPSPGTITDDIFPKS